MSGSLVIRGFVVAAILNQTNMSVSELIEELEALDERDKDWIVRDSEGNEVVGVKMSIRGVVLEVEA